MTKETAETKSQGAAAEKARKCAKGCDRDHTWSDHLKELKAEVAAEKIAHNSYTPGPWELEESDGTIRNRTAFETSDQMGDYRGVIICDMSTALGTEWPSKARKHAESETRANARLIAAGPELLEALEAIIKGVDAAYINLGMDDRWNYAGVRAIDAARAAIAKATVQWYTKEYKSAGNE